MKRRCKIEDFTEVVPGALVGFDVEVLNDAFDALLPRFIALDGVRGYRPYAEIPDAIEGEVAETVLDTYRKGDTADDIVNFCRECFLAKGWPWADDEPAEGGKP